MDLGEVNAAIAAAGKELGRLKKEKASKNEVDDALARLQELKNKKGELDPSFDPSGKKAKKTKGPKGKPKNKAALQEKQRKQRAEARAEISRDKGRTFSIDKFANFPLWYEQICGDDGARLVDKMYPVKGMPVFTPNGFFMHNKIMQIIEQEWEKQGIDKAQFPLLIPESFLTKEEEHVRGFEEEVFWVTKGGLHDLHERLALRPTSETAMYSMFSKWVQSFRDLPIKVHQTCSVFRYETKDTRPLIRAREIHWNEAHTAHTTREEALENLENAWKSYLYLISDVCGVYGLRIRRPEWDKFAGSEHTDVLDVILPDGKVLQVVGAHYLGKKFAKVFDVKYLNSSNEYELVHMTCYGISTRILASVLGVHGDTNGLRVPSRISKYHVVIVPIKSGKLNEEVAAKAEEYKKNLIDAGIRTIIDDGDKKPGLKYFYWEMMGVPIRMELGPRDLTGGCVTLARRDQTPKDKIQIPEGEVVETIHVQLEEHDRSLREASKTMAESYITLCFSIEEVKEIMDNNRGFAKIPFHSVGFDGEKADDELKEKTGAEVRGFLVNDEAPPEGSKCLVTGKPATVYAYCARSY